MAIGSHSYIYLLGEKTQIFHPSGTSRYIKLSSWNEANSQSNPFVETSMP